jgi:hypothetical protein
MSYAVRDKQTPVRRLAMFAAFLATVFSLSSCGKSENSAASEKSAPAEKQVAQKTFASPEDAGGAFVAAAKSGDQGALIAIFGPDTTEVVLSGDAVKDKDNLQDFVAAYNQMHRWREIKVGGEMLYVGADNYLFPIPLGKNPAGQWYFDTAAGKDEILARRIGKNELGAITACAFTRDAQQEYFRETHDAEKVKQYAQKFVSDEGKQNGLFWKASDGQAASPLAEVGDFAKAQGYTNSGSNPQPFNGYLFRILTRQGDKAKGGAKDYMKDGKLTGGFAILAWPTEYRNSGIMTFVVGTDGVVHQKDLGEKTSDVAAAMTEYNPDDSWSPAI